ncbi:hypothetical protein I2W78_02155 [Streptomyces spinoverrucosus]|uniref:hypothetical protein n=1 Tax=Streptomyces spinoverrucosus TaxID=284043 RepID=UPI0018C352B1|nr:hypothetical protein [Streptomyces spinoverrucosus]MBG0850687.1 hypothetical protein [Streptomyces spinoverrucosus]
MTKHSENGKHPEEHAETAREQVLREIRDAEPRKAESPDDRRHQGEAGDAITPDTDAQEESSGD